MRMVDIYGLYDPEEPDLIRYVGKAKKCKSRHKSHIYEARKGGTFPRHEWIRLLLARGIEPQVYPLERVPEENWKTHERWWIAFFPKGQLLNQTAGGDGVENLAPEAAARIGASSRKRMMGNTLRKGVTLTEEEGAAISAGLLASEKFRAASIAKRGKPSYVRTEEIKKKNADGNKGYARPDVSARLKVQNPNPKGKFKCITNGVQNRRIPKADPIPEGWWEGIGWPDGHPNANKPNPRFSALGKALAEKRRGKMRWITDGVTIKNWFPGDPMPDGWRLGWVMNTARGPGGKFVKSTKQQDLFDLPKPPDVS